MCNFISTDNKVMVDICSKLQGEYEQEGIDIKRVGYEDNRPLLELLLTVSAMMQYGDGKVW